MKSRTIMYLLLTFILSNFLLSCNKDEVQPTQSGQLVMNSSVETGSMIPNGWYYDTGQGKYNLNWNDQVAFSPSKSLEISTQTGETINFAFWGQTISNNLPIGKTVTLKVKIKGNLSGTGISIAIRGDNTTQLEGSGEQFVTSQGVSPISGTFDWEEYSVTLNKVDASTKSLSVFLVYLPNTTGEVYFDDIKLTF